MWSTPAVWKQYNKMAVLHFFLVNSPLIYILNSVLKGSLSSRLNGSVHSVEKVSQFQNF